MGFQKRFERTILATQNASVDGQQTFEIPRGDDLAELTLFCSGIVTNTTAFAALKADGIPQIIKKLEFLVNDSEVIYTVDGAQLVYGSMYRIRGGAQFSVTQPLVALGWSAFEFECTIDVAPILARADFYKQGTLRTANYNNVTLRITYGNLSDVFTGAGAGTIAFNALTNRMSVVQYQEIATRNDDGSLELSVPSLRAYRVYNVEAVGVGGAYRRKLDVNQLVRGLSIRTTDASGATLSSLIDTLTIYVGTEARFAMSGQFLRERTRCLFSVAPRAGWYYVDFASRFGGEDSLNDMLNNIQSENGNVDITVEISTTAAAIINVSSHGFKRV